MSNSASTANLSVHPIQRDELDAWLALADTGTLSDQLLAKRLRSVWAEGTGGGPDLTFVLERDGRPIGRLAYLSSPAASVLPDAHEASITGVWLPWEAADAVELGTELVTRSLATLAAPIRWVDAWVNPEYMPGADARRSIFEAAGFPLFQEKLGFRWTADGPPGEPLDRPRRLTFTAVPDLDPDLLASVMSRSTDGSLDRQDRYYAALVGRDNWGPEMLTFRTPDDDPSWLLAFDERGAPVGYVLLGTFDEPDRGTIVHIGVLPEARGNGYVRELLAEIEAHARHRGFTSILSDSDVENAPMHAAFERAGHRSDATAWHVWHYRLAL